MEHESLPDNDYSDNDDEDDGDNSDDKEYLSERTELSDSDPSREAVLA